MTIKRTAPRSAEITLQAEELEAWGIRSQPLSLKSSGGRRLLHDMLALLAQTCGLHRDGNYTLIRCRPLRQGGCRLSAEFTRLPSARLYRFDTADDLLDAFNAMNYIRHFDYFTTNVAVIHPFGDKFFMYIPHTLPLSQHEKVILSEYAALFPDGEE